MKELLTDSNFLIYNCIKACEKNPQKHLWENITITYNTEEFNIKNNCYKRRLYEKQGNGKEIGCFGCSNTFGLALPEEMTWAYQLNELLGFDKYDVKNYGIVGASIETTILTIYDLIINQNKKFETIFILFPDFFRYMYSSSDDDNKIWYDDFVIHDGDNGDYDYDVNLQIKSHHIFTNEMYAFFNFVKMYKLLEEACKSKNIPFYWFSWSANIVNLDNKVIDTFLNTHNFINNDNIPELIKLEMIDLAADGEHIGPKYSKKLAECFYEKYTKENTQIY